MAEPSGELVQRAQAGDEEAVVALVQGQQTYVYSIAMTLMGSPADAADMTQDAFVRVLRSLGTFRGETRFTTWLYRLVTNVCLDGLRRRGRTTEASLDEEDDSGGARVTLADADLWADPEKRWSLIERGQEVRAALALLPSSQRLALALHYFEDRSYEDVALVMGLPMNTVRSHIRRGKLRLIELLAEAEPRRAR